MLPFRLSQQLKAIGQDLAARLAAEPELARKLAHLTSVPSIGLPTAIVVVAETSGNSPPTLAWM